MKFFDRFLRGAKRSDSDGSASKSTGAPEVAAFLLSKESVLALAPDALTRETAEIIANPTRWFLVAEVDGVLWGTYKRDKKPVVCAVILQNQQFHCSCPSAARPCKHALALYLLRVLTPDVVLRRQVPPAVVSALKLTVGG